jgi:hypothetical protein
VAPSDPLSDGNEFGVGYRSFEPGPVPALISESRYGRATTSNNCRSVARDLSRLFLGRGRYAPAYAFMRGFTILPQSAMLPCQAHGATQACYKAQRGFSIVCEPPQH